MIGIPSVKRNGVSYLLQTLHSIFHNVYPVNEDSIFVVVMLAETDEDFVKSSGRLVPFLSVKGAFFIKDKSCTYRFLYKRWPMLTEVNDMPRLSLCRLVSDQLRVL